MRELLPVDRRWVAVDVDIGHLLQGGDESGARALGVLGSGALPNRFAKRLPDMGIASQTPLAMNNIEPVLENPTPWRIGAAAAARADKHARRVGSRFKRSAILSAGVEGLAIGIERLHFESLSGFLPLLEIEQALYRISDT